MNKYLRKPEDIFDDECDLIVGDNVGLTDSKLASFARIIANANGKLPDDLHYNVVLPETKAGDISGVIPEGEMPCISQENLYELQLDKGAWYVIPTATLSNAQLENAKVLLDGDKELGYIYGNVITALQGGGGSVDELISFVAMTDEEIVPYKQHKVDVREKTIAALIGLSSRTIDFNLETLISKEDVSRHIVQEHSKALIAEQRRHELVCIEIEAMKRSKGEFNEDEQRADIEDLLASPMLEDIRVKHNLIANRDDDIVFKTRDIVIKDIGGNVHPIGKFTVTVKLDTADVKMINTDNKIDKQRWDNQAAKIGEYIQHPHCNEYGSPCLGNMADYLSEACGRRDVPTIWQLVLSYLTSYNENDIWGKRLSFWLDENGEKVTRSEIEGNGTLEEEDDDDDDWETCEICEESYQESDMFTCEECGKRICINCLITSDYRNSNTGDFTHYCEECSNEHYDDVHDEVVPINEDLGTCAKCGSRTVDGKMFTGENGMYCCEECLEEAEGGEGNE